MLVWKQRDYISLNSNNSPIVSKNDCSIPIKIKKLYYKIHPKEVETDICDQCLDPKQIVCQECTKDQNMLVEMDNLFNWLGTICTKCVIINSKKCSLHLCPARVWYCSFQCKEYICGGSINSATKDYDLP